jgi:cell wall-associated NlpC family hydrolase
MDEKLDKLLKRTLTLTDEPSSGLNRRILDLADTAVENGLALGQTDTTARKEQLLRQRGLALKPTGKRAGKSAWATRRLAAAALTAMLLAGGSLSALAAWKFLSPQAAAEQMHDLKLAEAFRSGAGALINETQCFGGYEATLLGVISGENLSDYVHLSDGTIMPDRTYAVAAIGTSDGTPMPEFPDTDFFVSPLIQGYNPAFYNAASMGGSCAAMWSDGLLYLIADCDNVEIFSDHNIYFCILDSTFYSAEAYLYEKETGTVTRNESYGGLNALFQLPLSPSRANPQKAEAYIESLGITEKEFPEDKLSLPSDNVHVAETTPGNEKGAEAAEYALSFVGNPYLWGGSSLTEGTDSSGFAMSIYENFDISLPHSTKGQREQGTQVEDLTQALPGDLLFYESPSHVAVYIGNGKIVHAHPTLGICVSEADFDQIVMIRRIFSSH